MPVETTAPEPVLNDATRDFVRRTMLADLVDLAEIKRVVVSLITEKAEFSPQALADGLVGADLLTSWQARKLLAGKARGFHLGNYRLLRPLGRGGMGVVFLARHSVMNRLMALKILPSEASRDARRIERFKEEARASAQLEHPNIVQAFDFCEADEKLFIVMEYVRGADLHRAVARDGVMSNAEALDAMIQTTDALVHAHQRGIIHRDIKPSNLLLRNDGVVKVSDMGLARVGYASPQAEDSPNRLTGTADFIAPEQALDSRAADSRSDVYSLGCTWYFLLVGKTPYQGTSVAQRLAKHQTAPIPSVSQQRADCPAAVSTLIQRMMSKQPTDRPASAAELLAQLKRIGGIQHSSGELANRQRGGGSTGTNPGTSEEASGYSSLDESGLLAEATSSQFAEIDFGSLPPIETAAGHPSASSFPIHGALQASQEAEKMSKSQSFQTRKPNQRASPNQNVLLGIGLAISTLALLAVVGITIHQMTQTRHAQPTIKSMEQGSKHVIIVRE